MGRKVKKQVTGFRTKDGAGVSLVRVLGHDTTEEFDPILMLDSFDSTDPDEYTAGFPIHPHRGIETISYLYKGKMVHKDSLGNEDAIGDGEVQWMNSGSGILHEEQVPAADRLLGVQLWLNLPAKDKMSKPSYNSIKRHEIKEVQTDGAMIRVIAGSYQGTEGYKGEHLPLDYYDIHLEKNSSITINTDNNASVMLFTLAGEIYVGNELIKEKTAVKLTEGNSVHIKSTNKNAQVLYIKSIALNEGIAWAGPIVMNTKEEIQQAYDDLRNDNFIKEKIDY
ncbi:MAG: pirin family protein [Tissierellia bacterium]|jgi:redox-sensitive bicupin YhaK (pirin superfamily)|nr:pirin family protein [Tissierellia bacterium]